MPVNAPNENLNWPAPSFKLMNIDNHLVSLDQIKGKHGTVIVFICNHCPYVKAIASRLSYEANELKKESISTVAIMSNDTKKYPEDSFDNMKIFSKKFDFKFPYLIDEKQDVAKSYNAVCTPDFFGFDKNLMLKYRGRIDSKGMNSDENEIIDRELFNSMMHIKKTGTIPNKQINSVGCSIKWK